MKIPPLPQIEHDESSTTAENPAKPCWRCGASSNPPNLDEQVAVLVDLHQRLPPVFWLRDGEARRLRGLLQEGDVLAQLRNVHQIASAMYDTFAVIRDGQVVMISRGELQDA